MSRGEATVSYPTPRGMAVTNVGHSSDPSDRPPRSMPLGHMENKLRTGERRFKAAALHASAAPLHANAPFDAPRQLQSHDPSGRKPDRHKSSDAAPAMYGTLPRSTPAIASTAMWEGNCGRLGESDCGRLGEMAALYGINPKWAKKGANRLRLVFVICMHVKCVYNVCVCVCLCV